MNPGHHRQICSDKDELGPVAAIRRTGRRLAAMCWIVEVMQYESNGVAATRIIPQRAPERLSHSRHPTPHCHVK
jgi:hypothetical protein